MSKRKKCEYLKDPEIFRKILGNYDNFIFDCDGVLWNNNEVNAGVKELLDKLRKMNKKILIATNNSSKSRKEYQEKCGKLDLNVKLEEIYCTVHVICYYLENYFKFQNKKVFLIGSESFKKELEKINVKVLPFGPEHLEGDVADWINKTSIDPEVEGVIVGFDKNFNYYKCLKAVSYLKNPRHLFIATNTDELFPSKSETVVIPGTGSIVACVEHSACRKPWISGKPHDPMFQCMIHEHKLDLSKTLFVGDRLNTDILGANRKGMLTILVLSGVTSKEDVEKLTSSQGLHPPGMGYINGDVDLLYPDYYTDSLSILNSFLV
ncbi:unnamed protein product [Gordionus sp. m RMFG-2023]|uniref:uncharacterized protein LOC135931814 n=1 Tax=Gordionus sp. m RMFG-2023 TaxID=3053472 RepID=UPI0030E29D61